MSRGSPRILLLFAGSVATIGLSSCALESPVSITDRPLAEELEEQGVSRTSVPEALEVGETVAPGALAFNEALADGAFVRLHITDEGIPAALRSGPGSAYDQLSDIPAGSEVLATGNQTGDWVHVMYADFEGWITTRRISFESSDGRQDIIAASDVDRTPVTYVVIGQAIGVNMRAEPDATSDLVSGAAVGSQVEGTGRTEGTWIEVIFDGVTGWASGNYLQPTDAPTAPPSATAPSTSGAPSGDATVDVTQNTDE